MKNFKYHPPTFPIDILYVDDNLIIVNKPSGLLSVPGRAEEHKDSLSLRLTKTYPTLSVVHRLDMDTSGLIVFALNKETHRALSKQFELKQVQKTYIAVVDGIMKDSSGKIDLPMRCDWPNRPLQIIDFEHGKAAQTHWNVLHYDEENKTTCVQLTPITGRSHQLRLHCQQIGHPIIGDRFYAEENTIKKSERLCLHAQEISFTHPVTEEFMKFRCEAEFY